MANHLTLAEISAEILNTNFTNIENAVNAKAELNGDAEEKFNVADAVELTEAINKKQLNNSVAAINASITEIETTLESEIATKADKTYVDNNLALKANSADVTASLATKICVIDTYSSGTSWYRSWSDGWIEQGGLISNWTGTITFLKPFLNTNYSFNCNPVTTQTGSGCNMPGESSSTPRTTTRIVLAYQSSGTTNNGGIYWRACGY